MSNIDSYDIIVNYNILYIKLCDGYNCKWLFTSLIMLKSNLILIICEKIIIKY